MRFSVIQNMRAYCNNERFISSDDLEPKASIRFIVKHENVLVMTTNGGSENILGQSSRRWPEQVFDIEFRHLLLPLLSLDDIHEMLTQIEIPPSTIEALKLRIVIFAYGMASICRQQGYRFLDMVVDLNFQFIEGYEEQRSNEEDLERIQDMLMDIERERGFGLVPASRSSIEALEIKKFDDTEDASSSSIETCTICMDEFVRGVDIAKLPCSHSFHGECIIKWLENKNSCPLCRFAMPTEEEEEEEEE